MGPSAFGYREDAKDGSHSYSPLRTQNLDAPQLCKFLICVKIILFQPLWNCRILSLSASQLYRRNDSVGVPIYETTLSVNPHEMRDRSV